MPMRECHKQPTRPDTTNRNVHGMHLNAHNTQTVQETHIYSDSKMFRIRIQLQCMTKLKYNLKLQLQLQCACELAIN